MHPYVIIQNRLLIVFVSLITMVILPNNANPAYIYANRCLGPVQNVALYNKDSGYVMVKNKAVLVNKALTYGHYLNQISLRSGYVTWFDPKAKKFICWNNTFRKLIAKARPHSLERHCMFKEEASHKTGYTKYTIQVNGTTLEMKFSRKGFYPLKCEKRRHKARPLTCGEARFLPSFQDYQNCTSNTLKFCKQIQKLYHDRRKVPRELNVSCHQVWNL